MAQIIGTVNQGNRQEWALRLNLFNHRVMNGVPCLQKIRGVGTDRRTAREP